MSQSVQRIIFQGSPILTIEQDGVHYVAMKPVCENIGLDWDGQRQRINRHAFLNSTAVMITAVAEDGKLREMQMLPVKYLQGWLFTVDANRVKPAIKERLITYQKECFDVLHQYWSSKSRPLETNDVSTAACFSELHVYVEVTRGRMRKSVKGTPYNTVSMTTALVLQYLCQQLKDDQESCISTRQISRELKIDSTTVSRSMTRMSEWSFLSLRTGSNRRLWVTLHHDVIQNALKTAQNSLLTHQQSVGYLPASA